MSSNTPRIDLVERNLIINGNFDFWQRGTSLSASANGTYVADRWKIFASTSGVTYSVTASQSTDVPTQAQSGFQSRYSLLLTNGTGASPASGSFIQAIHYLEGQDYQTLHGRKARLQFWCKSSVTGTFPVALQNGAQNRSYVTTFAVTSANTWQKVALDLTLDTAGSWNFDNTAGLGIAISLTMGSTFQTSSLNTWQSAFLYGATGQTQWGAITGATFQLAQVMLIPQDFTQAGATTVDVPFQRAGRSIGHELQMCQRYCYVIPNGTISNLAQRYGSSTTGAVEVRVIPPVPWRAAPSFNNISGATGQSGQSPATGFVNFLSYNQAAWATFTGTMSLSLNFSNTAFADLFMSGGTWTSVVAGESGAFSLGSGVVLSLDAEL